MLCGGENNRHFFGGEGRGELYTGQGKLHAVVETSTLEAAVTGHSWLGTLVLKSTNNKYTVISRRNDKFKECFQLQV